MRNNKSNIHQIVFRQINNWPANELLREMVTAFLLTQAPDAYLSFAYISDYFV